MTKLDRKAVIKECLKRSPGNLSTAELISKLGEEFKERTVRRLLAELINEGAIKQSGQGRSTRYQYHTQNPSERSAHSFVFSALSQQSIEHVKKPLFDRPPVGYQQSFLDDYIPNQTSYFSEIQLKQMEAASIRTHKPVIEPAGTFSKKILNRLLIDLSYNSSRLEGNTYSLLDTEKLLIEGVGALEKLDEERVMILNHKDAIEFLVRNAPELEVSYSEVCTLHYLLADGLLQPPYLGKVRTDTVRISHSTYSPIENTNRLTQNLNIIATKAANIQNPYEQSLFLLVHISYLQPFIDVNKRTSRLSANIPLIRENLVPLSFNDLSKDDYLSAILSIYELNETLPLAELYLASYLRSCKHFDVAVESMGFDPIRVKYRQQRRKLISKILRECLTGAEMRSHITAMSEEIDVNDRQAFQQSVDEELNNLDEIAIAGLGVSKQELSAWKSRGQST